MTMWEVCFRDNEDGNIFDKQYFLFRRSAEKFVRNNRARQLTEGVDIYFNGGLPLWAKSWKIKY